MKSKLSKSSRKTKNFLSYQIYSLLTEKKVLHPFDRRKFTFALSRYKRSHKTDSIEKIFIDFCCMYLTKPCSDFRKIIEAVTFAFLTASGFYLAVLLTQEDCLTATDLEQ